MVDQYHFGESDPNKCFQEHPVEYLLDSEKRSGWLRPYTKEIVDYPTKVRNKEHSTIYNRLHVHIQLSR